MPRHRWVAIVVYDLSEADAHRSYVEEQVVELRRADISGVAGPVCYKCEAHYSEALPECPGPPIERADADPPRVDA